MSPRVAIIGAGMAGLVAARALQTQCEVVVFEKSRGVGGRIATRQHEQFFFDHGAQFFYAKTDSFQAYLAPYLAQGVVQIWQGRFQERDSSDVLSTREWTQTPAHYVGVPSMNALPKALAEGLDIRRMTRISQIEKTAHGWRLGSHDGFAQTEFDWVILAIPVEQAQTLLPADIAFAPVLDSIKMQACYSLMLGFAIPPAMDFDAALIHGADISWISLNSSKPGRSPYPTLLVHSTNRWAEVHTDLPREAVIQHLLEETCVHVPTANEAMHVDVQRWLYANADKRPAEAEGADGCFVDTTQQLIACGDWCIHGRIEAAFLSGQAAASALIAQA